MAAHMTDADQEAVRIADRVLARVARGVTAGREMYAAETLPVLRALALWRAAALAGADALAAAKMRATD